MNATDGIQCEKIRTEDSFSTRGASLTRSSYLVTFEDNNFVRQCLNKRGLLPNLRLGTKLSH